MNTQKYWYETQATAHEMSVGDGKVNGEYIEFGNVKVTLPKGAELKRPNFIFKVKNKSTMNIAELQGLIKELSKAEKYVYSLLNLIHRAHFGI